jgi:hypothetical protein
MQQSCRLLIGRSYLTFRPRSFIIIFRQDEKPCSKAAAEFILIKKFREKEVQRKRSLQKKKFAEKQTGV